MTSPIGERPIARSVYLQVIGQEGGKSYSLRAGKIPFPLEILDERSRAPYNLQGTSDDVVRKEVEYAKTIHEMLQPQAGLFRQFNDAFSEFRQSPDFPEILQRFFNPMAEKYRKLAFEDQFQNLDEARDALTRRLHLFECSTEQVPASLKDAYQGALP